MVAVQQGRAIRVNVLWLAVGLALLAALSYVPMGLGVLGVGDLDTSEAPAAITYVAAGGYLLGGRARGKERWKLPEGDLDYIECAITELEYTR